MKVRQIFPRPGKVILCCCSMFNMFRYFFLSVKQNYHIAYTRSLQFYQEDYIVLNRQNQIIHMHDRFNLYESLLVKCYAPIHI